MAVNAVTATGLTTKTYDDLVSYFTTAFQTIYGADINLASDSPDGQMMNIMIQAALDNLDLAVAVYNNFDPDAAIGVVLDQRVAYNLIERQGGTYSVTPITIVTSGECSLIGLSDPSITEETQAYTITDNVGNNWYLMDTQNVADAETITPNFRAASTGAIETTINTITTPVTIVLNVTSVNNPGSQTTIGINEETDAQLKVRRRKSVAISSQGYFSSLLAALEDVNGVTSAFVYENMTDSVDGDGVPGHSIWVIVAGDGLAADIANAIYTKRNAGCGMYGAINYVITQKDGSAFVVKWDDVSIVPLYIQFNATSLDGVNTPNTAAILSSTSGLPVTFVPGVYGQVNSNELATLVQDIDPNTLVSAALFSVSNTGPWFSVLKPTSKNQQFEVTAANISITVV